VRFEYHAFSTEPDGRCAVDIGEQRRCEMVNKDQVKGTAKQAAGSVEEAAGKLTGNKKTEAKGAAKKAEGEVQKSYGNVKEKIKDAL
jgi:uncharacterized protein YjbJ (UPF0337 family)